MEFIFKQAALFGPNQRFGLGRHKVSEDIQKHHYFKLLLKAGLVVSSEGIPAVSPDGFVAQQKIMVEKTKAEGMAKAKEKVEVDGSEEVELPTPKHSKKR